MNSTAGAPRKPKALRPGSRVEVFAPASPAEMQENSAGMAELRRLGFHCIPPQLPLPEGYFAGSREERLESFLDAMRDSEVAALVSLRGGYGANYLLQTDLASQLGDPKCVIGFSDVTTLHAYLWRQLGWVTFYGPMLAAGFNHGAGAARGYDEDSFVRAVCDSREGWSVALDGETMVAGEAEGIVLGGCLTLLQTTLGTPWEIETDGAILLLEDTHLKPYQVDRSLMHLLQAGKLQNIRGVILGEFPGSEPSLAGSPTVRSICERLLGPLRIPVVFGAPVGHTRRPLLTIPLGIRGRLTASGHSTLEFLEPAVTD